MSNTMDKIDTIAHPVVRDTDTRPISKLKKGSLARIVQVSEFTEFGENNKNVSQRLKELGFLPGAAIKVIGFGFLSNAPIAIGINGTKFALRPAEASKILVIPIVPN